MASQLNGYRNFINIQIKEGQALVFNAVDKFISPLVGDERVQLLGKDLQKLKDNLLQLRSRYGYDHLIKRCATVRTVIPEIVDDPAAVPPVVGVPEEINYTNSINFSSITRTKTLCWLASMLHSPGVIARSQLWHQTPSNHSRL